MLRTCLLLFTCTTLTWLNSKYMYMVRLSFKRKSYNKKGVVHVILDFKRKSSTITAYLMGSVVITFDIGDRSLFKCRGWGRGAAKT